MANMFSFVALGVSTASIACALLALVLPYWETFKLLEVSVHAGLFRTCGDICVNTLDTVTGDMKIRIQATQAVVLMGCITLAGSLVFFILLLYVMKGRKVLGYIAGFLSVAGGFFLMVGMGIYADKLKGPGTTYGASFAVDIIGWLAGWVAGGLMLFITFFGVSEF